MLPQTFFYLMFKPDGSARLELSRLRRRLGIPETYASDRLHISLLPLGPEILWSANMLKWLDEILSGFESAPIQIEFDRLEGSTLRGATGLSAVRVLHRKLTRHMERAGFSLSSYRFNPHVTLAYAAERPRSRVMIDPIRWTANQILLIRSGHGQHDVKNCWRLASPQIELPFA